MSNFILKLLPAIANHLQLEPGVAKRPRLSLARRAWATLLPLTEGLTAPRPAPFGASQNIFIANSNLKGRPSKLMISLSSSVTKIRIV